VKPISAKTHFFAIHPFHNRSLFWLWTGELVSTAGSALSTLAASVLVYRQTGSTWSVSLLLVAAALPSLLIGLLAGVFVDRFDRKRIMLVSDLARAGLAVTIPFLVPRNLVWLYGMVMLSSSVGQFFNPAHESVLPEIAPEPERGAANSLMAISGFGATTLGFALGGLIVSHFPLQWAFYLDAFSFIFSASCIWRIPIQPLRVAEHTNTGVVVANLKAGGKFLLGNAALRSLFLVSIPVLLAFGLWNSLLLPFTLHILHATASAYGIQEGLTCLGCVAGCLLVKNLGSRITHGQWIVLSFLGMGALGGYYALSTNVPLAIGLVVLTGFMNAPYAIARRLVIQSNTHREVRGRVNSAFFVVRDVVYLAGMAAAGLADAYGIRGLVLASALLLIGAGLAALWMPGLLGSSRSKVRKAANPTQLTPQPGLPLPRMDALL
jgi:MFS family permease